MTEYEKFENVVQFIRVKANNFDKMPGSFINDNRLKEETDVAVNSLAVKFLFRLLRSDRT